ncbi:MAG: TetR/AcrR family transcriptional regulator, partial [Rikenellaceae bacterium]|nr:TetR/AcrR family transcriptional regulator [Rikenellaceae bacterium]
MELPQDHMEARIIQAAGQLFVEKGFEETSMSDIAARVGINRTALHNYFRTKEKMFQAVFGDIVQEFLPRLQFIFMEEIPLIDKFGKVLDEYFEIFRENPSLPQFILSEIQRDVNHLLAV